MWLFKGINTDIPSVGIGRYVYQYPWNCPDLGLSGVYRMGNQTRYLMPSSQVLPAEAKSHK